MHLSRRIAPSSFKGSETTKAQSSVDLANNLKYSRIASRCVEYRTQHAKLATSIWLPYSYTAALASLLLLELLGLRSRDSLTEIDQRES